MKTILPFLGELQNLNFFLFVGAKKLLILLQDLPFRLLQAVSEFHLFVNFKMQNLFQIKILTL